MVGTNADLMLSVAHLYLEPDDVVIDATWGIGSFWTKLPGLPSVAHDLHTLDGVDLRALPEPDASADVVVLDPPYRAVEDTAGRRAGETPHNAEFTNRYGVEDASLRTPEDVIALYGAGIAEARRVLNRRGRLLVKCQDTGHGRGFVSMVPRLTAIANATGFETVDLFVLHAGTGPGSGRWLVQNRSRRAHSYLLVFAASQYWARRERFRLPEHADQPSLFD